MYNQSDDLRSAIANNGLDDRFDEKDIDAIIAEVPGENDGYDWHWLVSLSGGRFAYLQGGCDYSGWDCQSHLDVMAIEDSVDKIMESVTTDGSQGNIRQFFADQLTGKFPVGAYEIKNNEQA